MYEAASRKISMQEFVFTDISEKIIEEMDGRI